MIGMCKNVHKKATTRVQDLGSEATNAHTAGGGTCAALAGAAWLRSTASRLVPTALPAPGNIIVGRYLHDGIHVLVAAETHDSVKVTMLILLVSLLQGPRAAVLDPDGGSDSSDGSVGPGTGV